jgi:hypothetical protein
MMPPFKALWIHHSKNMLSDLFLARAEKPIYQTFWGGFK